VNRAASFIARRAGLVLAGLLAAAGVQAAARTDICYSAQTPPGAAPPTNATVFACPQAGNRTVPELAAAGWRVVRMAPVVADGGAAVRQQLLVRDDTLFVSGFEPT